MPPRQPRKIIRQSAKTASCTDLNRCGENSGGPSKSQNLTIGLKDKVDSKFVEIISLLRETRNFHSNRKINEKAEKLETL
jgi:hypothetical protein